VYDHLEGEIALRSPTRLVLDVGGVGYDLAVPLSSGFPARGRVRAWVHHVVREDEHLLMGFEDRATRDLFRLLLRVRGIGPALAMALLSNLPASPLLEAIAGGDVARLSAVRGVGRRTAEQILLDLRERAVRLRAQLSGEDAPAAPPTREEAVEDAVAALVSIGYSDKEARTNVERAAARVDRRDVERLVRAALSS